MALILCKECGNKVSDKADKCPSCGAAVPKDGWVAKGCGLVILVFIGSIVVASLVDKNTTSPAPTEAAQTEPAGEQKITGGTWFGCSDKDFFNKLGSMLHDHDKKAFESVYLPAVMTGECIKFKAGEPVFMDEYSWGLVKLRQKGETEDYWTYAEAIKGPAK